MSATATAMLNACRSQLWFREGPNNDSPYGAWYGFNHQPYCAMGLSWAAAQCGALDIMHGKWASCPAWMAAFQRNHEFLPWDVTPRAGDIVFFDWSGEHGSPDHVGIVEKDDGVGIVTVEFNTTNGVGNRGGVWRRRRSRMHVAGYGRPKYAQQTAPVPAPRTSARPPVPLVIDGVWGPLTTKRMQTWLGRPVTGVIDTATRRALQARLHVATDGEWGPITHRALQLLLHVAADGVWGPVTVKAFQRFLNRAVN